MAFRLTVWLLGLMFIATVYNVTTAYSALGSMDVHNKFQTIGLIEYTNAGHIIPERKPVAPEMLASAE